MTSVSHINPMLPSVYPGQPPSQVSTETPDHVCFFLGVLNQAKRLNWKRAHPKCLARFNAMSLKKKKKQHKRNKRKGRENKWFFGAVLSYNKDIQVHMVCISL